MKLTNYLSVLALVLATQFALNSQDVLLKDVNYIDVTNGTAVEDTDILIANGKIKQIAKDISSAMPINTINLKGKWCVPGLIDSHIHFFQSGSLYTRPDAIDLRKERPYDVEIQWLQDHAEELLQSYLKAGVTTVVDVGGPMHNYKIREQFSNKNGLPNILVTGPLVSTYQPEAFQIEDPPIVKVTTEEEARDLVRMQLPFKPDFIKIWYIHMRSMPASETYNLIAAAVDESHKNNLKVAIHATQLNTAKLAVKAGANILVHSVSMPIDDEFIDMVKANNVSLIPTLVVHGNYNLAFLDMMTYTDKEYDLVSPEIIGWLQDVRHLTNEELKRTEQYKDQLLAQDHANNSVRKANLKMLSDSGVNLSTGTDAGNIGTLHAASYMDELMAMKESGMTNAAILKASTIGAAKAFGQENNLGSIEVGKLGDLVVLDKNPLDDLAALGEVSKVLKSGAEVPLADYAFSSPEEVAQKQLNAYNAGDIDAFVACYSDDVKVFNFPDQLQYQGKETMREGYAGFFENNPKLHCELVKRIVLGHTIIDEEKVTGLSNGASFSASAIYKIKDGLINEVYFLLPD